VTSPIARAQDADASPPPRWIARAADWLTPRRIRSHALILALGLWAVCAIDFATPGLLDRAGNIKFQDFLPFYISAHLITQGRAADLYNQQVIQAEVEKIVGHPTQVRVPYLYGPQVAFFFTPLSRFSFATAARLWSGLSLILFFACIYLLWKSCPNLKPYPGTVTLCALAFPPLFHFFVRGQNSALVLACFTAAWFAFRAQREWLAGLALGFLIFKPQFLVAIPIILLLSRAWRPLFALILSAAAQLAFAGIYFGSAVLNAYVATMLHPSRWLPSAELTHAEIQMHSLRAFWSLLIPWSQPAFVLCVLCAIAVIAIATLIWMSPAPLSLRFSALILAAVLVNPHLFIYDLLVLAPALLLLTDWAVGNEQHAVTPLFRLLIYLSFALPLFGPLCRWTHLQLSVPAFAATLWLLFQVKTHPEVAQ
jgi:hypothetical protein